jgi:hypothetical protein
VFSEIITSECHASSFICCKYIKLSCVYISVYIRLHTMFSHLLHIDIKCSLGQVTKKLILSFEIQSFV